MKNMHFSSTSSAMTQTHRKLNLMKNIVLMNNDANNRKEFQEIQTDNWICFFIGITG